MPECWRMLECQNATCINTYCKGAKVLKHDVKKLYNSIIVPHPWRSARVRLIRCVVKIINIPESRNNSLPFSLNLSNSRNKVFRDCFLS